MKELSIEEKAQAYDRAVDEISKLRDVLLKEGIIGEYGIINTSFERIFPELKESEDDAWSEEDKENISMLIDLVESKEESMEVKIELSAWLKSLKTKYTWKPTNEQMHYLYWIANVKLGDSVVEQEVSKHLNELYEDLKKLKGE